MTWLKALVLFGLTIAVACGDEPSKDENKFSGGRDEHGNCPQAIGTCDEATIDAYIECVDTKCGAEEVACLGEEYRSGTFSGTCGTYATCTSKCTCSDMPCMMACGNPDMTCVSCFQTVLNCRKSNCPDPVCLSQKTAGTGGGGGAGAGGSAGTAGM